MLDFVSMPQKKTIAESIWRLADSIYSVRDSISSGAKNIENCQKSIESAGKDIGKEMHYMADNLKKSVQVGAAAISIAIIFGFGTCQMNSNYVQRQELQEQKALYQDCRRDYRQLHREINNLKSAAYHTLEGKIHDSEK